MQAELVSETKTAYLAYSTYTNIVKIVSGCRLGFGVKGRPHDEGTATTPTTA